MASPSAHTGVPPQATSWRTEDDRPGYVRASNAVDVRGPVSAALGLEACGWWQ